ncbi:tyrosine-type recombinase/integrase [Bradyrhizobium iriomotense]|uniref:tyrosine-type recombinase/integrase n=1 Tax=Bradyrhizobium iriomotense TaxID=441950 RepID=UPI001FF023EE|nr:tyrosine-type recombinase/integrase [Bradyrhizobium iriomotense]
MRDLALFNVAIDSKLRGCDVVALKVDDLAPGGYSADRATVRQKKTGRPVKFELTESSRQAIDDYLRVTGKRSGEYLFTGRRLSGHMTTRQYARLLSRWLADIGLDPHLFGTHSLRRTKATTDRRGATSQMGHERTSLRQKIPYARSSGAEQACIADALGGGSFVPMLGRLPNGRRIGAER